MGEAGIGQDGGSALGGTDAQQIDGFAAMAEAIAEAELRDTLLLSSMDGQKAVEDLRVEQAWVLILDHLNHGPHRSFMRIARGIQLAAQTLAEAFTEMEFFRAGQARMVEIVVAVRVEEAVANDCRSQIHGLTEERLQAASGPGIAAGLDNVVHAEG